MLVLLLALLAAPGTAPAAHAALAAISVAPASGAPGTAATVSGSGFTPLAVVPLTWGPASGPLLASATANAMGQISAAVAIPAGAATGAQTITAVDPTAGATTTPFTVTSGSFTVTQPPGSRFPGITLTGLSQTITVTVGPITVTDERGSGAGWTLSVQSADLMNAEGHTIAFSMLSVAPAGATAAASGSSSAGSLTVGASGPLTGVDTLPGTTLSAPLTLLTAPPGQGLGQYQTTVPLTLTVPASAYTGTYTATLHLAVQ